MDLQLWSYNYEPEPTGIGPLSAVWAKAMVARGHRVEVVAAHPHYPDPVWGRRALPYRERRDGIPVLRLPLWPGRGSATQRLRQEATFTGALSLALPALGTPDAAVVVSPSFPALLPAMLNARLRRLPWVLWLQDILPDGAVATGILEEGVTIRASRRLERAAYRSAHRIVVISDSFAENLRQKGVPQSRIERIYNPASRPIRERPRPQDRLDDRLVLTMGNIGHSQNLAAVVRSFEASAALVQRGARFVMAGDGMAADEVRAEIRSDRVEITGILGDDELEPLLQTAALAVVSQGYEGIDFNVPSKLMNFMGYGIPVVASVRTDSEVARIVGASGCGWVTDSAETDELARVVNEALERPDERARRGEAGLRFAREHFGRERLAERFEDVVRAVARPMGGRRA